jgi:hypothetical protein
MSESGSGHANEGGARGASSSEPSRGRQDEPVQGGGEIEIPLGVPVSADELSRLKREAQRKEGTSQEPGEDPADGDVDGDDEG